MNCVVNTHSPYQSLMTRSDKCTSPLQKYQVSLMKGIKNNVAALIGVFAVHSVFSVNLHIFFHETLNRLVSRIRGISSVSKPKLALYLYLIHRKYIAKSLHKNNTGFITTSNLFCSPGME